ncbi:MULTISPECIES: helix-turn-helix domain-containing protein [unclassified Mesorhizobium]|uniref:helix-turn-helix domain-containing protein n=1 Tax=unclassified Mesorhizobium TaxID=325217 RepID=UPI003336AB1B
MVQRRGTARGLARRAQIVLLASEGIENKEIAARLGAMRNRVGTWRRHFAEQSSMALG